MFFERPHRLSWILGGLALGLGLACFDDPTGTSTGTGGCEDGLENCTCFENDTCLGTLECVNGLCVAGTGETGTSGDGDGDGDSGDGDGDQGDGDGDGDGDDQGDGDGDGDGDLTFCDQQVDVLLCYDFDGANPLEGLTPVEQHGSLDASNAQSVSPPNSLEVVVLGDDVDQSNVSVGASVSGAPVPFDGVLSAKAWLDPACLNGPERLLMALQFIDNGNPNGPFMLNLTLWVGQGYAKLYASDEGVGFPSTAYQFDYAFATGEWVDVAIGFAANLDTVIVTLGQYEEMIKIEEGTVAVLQEIAAIQPTISIGTAMAAAQPGCTMYFDDVIVAGP
jgi:hypothetical protein